MCSSYSCSTIFTKTDGLIFNAFDSEKIVTSVGWLSPRSNFETKVLSRLLNSDSVSCDMSSLILKDLITFPKMDSIKVVSPF